MTYNVSTPDSNVSIQTVFSVQLVPNVDGADSNGDLSSYAQIIGRSCMTDTGKGASLSKIIPDAVIAKILDESTNAVPTYFYSQGICRDTSLGGNDAINCYPQFNETDDVAEHPFLSLDSKDPQSGLGRVYAQTYNNLQQIMYLTFGVPRYNSLLSFYSNAMFADLAKIMINGGNFTGSTLGNLIGEAIGTYITLPVIPIVFIYNLFSGLTSIPITKYYDFSSAMPLYYRCVNGMLLHLCVNMGLVQDNFFLLGENPTTDAGKVFDKLAMEKAAESFQDNQGSGTSGLPPIFQKYGFDVYRILLKKYSYINAGLGVSGGSLPEHNSDFTLVSDNMRDEDKTPPTTNSAKTNTTSTSTKSPSSSTASNGTSGGSSTTNNDVSSGSADGSIEKDIKYFGSNFITGFKSQLYDANLFIGFKVEKGIDTSESFSNETGQSSIAQAINSKIQSVRDAKFTFENGNVVGPLSAALNAVTGVVSGTLNSVGLGSLDSIITGEGYLDFPEVWKDSSFSKSYSFTVSLRSPYGDPVSIMQNLYFPLCLLFAGAAPRAIGQASYTAPFICRAYCKGMFAVPLGMITSMTIKRGADQFGWSILRLPTCIDISFEIKDLSASMFMPIADSGSTLDAISQIFSTNSNFQEYLMTLSGMGLSERISWFRQLRLKANYLLGQVTEQKLNGFYWGASFGNTLPANAISVFMPMTKVPSN